VFHFAAATPCESPISLADQPLMTSVQPLMTSVQLLVTSVQPLMTFTDMSGHQQAVAAGSSEEHDAPITISTPRISPPPPTSLSGSRSSLTLVIITKIMLVSKRQINRQRHIGEGRREGHIRTALFVP